MVCHMQQMPEATSQMLLLDIVNNQNIKVGSYLQPEILSKLPSMIRIQANYFLTSE
uniref:Uncharacterized protein n=1 Tax=Arundo donax TaxID=35708 RepID=A0A0A9GVU1_ARUDO